MTTSQFQQQYQQHRKKGQTLTLYKQTLFSLFSMGHSNQKVGRSGAAARCTLCCIITKHIRPLPYTLNFTYIFSDQMEFHIFPQSHNCSSTTMSHYHGTYIHTHTQGLFEFLRNSFYLFLLRVKLLQCKILLPLNKKKNARIV